MPGFAELFLEIGCEEIPAGMIASAAQELQVILNKYLSSKSCSMARRSSTFGAPRRLVATCARVRLKQEDVRREVIGPPKSAAFDAQGCADARGRELRRKAGRRSREALHREHASRRIRRRRADRFPAARPPSAWAKSFRAPSRKSPGRRRCIGPAPRACASSGRSAGWWRCSAGSTLRLEVAGVDRRQRPPSGHRFLGKSPIPVSGYKDYLAKLREELCSGAAGGAPQESGTRTWRSWRRGRGCA